VYEFIYRKRPTLNAQRPTLNSEFDIGRSALGVGRSGEIVILLKKAPAFRCSLLRWFRRYERDLPWRQTRDPYAILVSEFMLQQTQVITVIPYYHEWLRRFPDFSALSRASGNDVLHAWQGLGYYARARNLHATARAVADRHRGRFTQSIEQMQQLPGIGKYTAHAIATFAFNQSVPIVEANTARVLTRLFDFRRSIESPAGRTTLWEYAASLLPKSNARTYNSALIDLGALVCIPRKPKCGICPVKKFCLAKNPETLPVRKFRSHTTRIVEKHAFVVCQGKVLLQQSSKRWRGMWILPPLQTSVSGQPLHISTFPFTHHRVTLAVYRRPAPKRIAPEQQWFESIDQIAMPSPHRRAAQSLVNSCSMNNRKAFGVGLRVTGV
jgi:A/G-specific adenine glycosylase